MRPNGIMAKAMRMIHSAVGGSQSNRGWDVLYEGRLPGSNIRWEEKAGELWLNSVIASGLGWIGDNFNEAPVRVVRDAKDGKREAVPGHALTSLLRRPNADSTGSDLMAAWILSWYVDGNAYALKAKSHGGYGKTGELWWVPPWEMRPAWPDNGREFISHYEYNVDGRWQDVDKKDVVHLRNGHDPLQPRLGLGPLKSGLRQIVGDNEGATYMAAILINGGMPAAIVSPDKAGTSITADQAKDLKRRFKLHFGGDRRGDILVQTVPLKWEKTSLSPEELALEKIFYHFESRLSALLKISPMVLGLQTGIEHSTYSNQETARKAGYENCVLPLQARFAEQLSWAFDGELIDAAREAVNFDISNVRALAESQQDLFTSITNAVGGPWVAPDEGRAMVNLPKIAGGDTLVQPVAPAPPGKDPAAGKKEIAERWRRRVEAERAV